MSALKAYLDDGGDPPATAVSVAGYVASCAAWGTFEVEWRKALEKHGLEYFHMREICDPKSPMHKFIGVEGELERKALLIDLISAIGRPNWLDGVGCIVPLGDLARFNAERQRDLQAIPLAIFVCMTLMKTLHRDKPIESVLDRIARPEKAIAMAKDYLTTSTQDLGKGEVSVLPLMKPLTSRNVKPLQAADLAVYEVFQNAKKRSLPFLNEVNIKAFSALDYWYEYEDWCERRGRQGRERQSFEALGSATPFRCPILTFDVLCEEDDLRGGRWSED